jgi:hypothetical protein
MKARPISDRQSLAQRVKEFWEGLKGRYKECLPECPPKEHIVTGFCTVSAWASLATFLPLDRKRKGSGGLEAYVFGWLLFLCSLLFFGPASGCWAAVWAWVGLYRLQDLVFASLDNVFGLTPRGIRWQDRPGVGPAVIALWNIAQVIVIYAIGYQNLAAGHGERVFDTPLGDKGGPSGHFGFLYLSWTTLFPPGSGFTAISTPARMLVMAESGSGLMIIGLTLAALLGQIDKSKTPGEATATTSTSSTERPDLNTVIHIRNIAIISFFSLGAGVVAGFAGGVLAGMLTFG